MKSIQVVAKALGDSGNSGGWHLEFLGHLGIPSQNYREVDRTAAVTTLVAAVMTIPRGADRSGIRVPDAWVRRPQYLESVVEEKCDASRRARS